MLHLICYFCCYCEVYCSCVINVESFRWSVAKWFMQFSTNILLCAHLHHHIADGIICNQLLSLKQCLFLCLSLFLSHFCFKMQFECGMRTWSIDQIQIDFATIWGSHYHDTNNLITMYKFEYYVSACSVHGMQIAFCHRTADRYCKQCTTSED